MSAQASAVEQSHVGDLYHRLIASWNRRDARSFAACFMTNGNAVGFDGTQMDGARQIEESLGAVFAGHPTAQYVTIVREVRDLGNEVVLLRAVTGMVPPGASRIKPDVNAIQSLVAQRIGADWKIALFQNTPAQFHGRAEAADALTQELQTQYDRTKK